MSKKNKSFFWASYADLMTSLFFVMLTLFVLTVLMLNKKMKVIDGIRVETQAKVDKIKEIEEALNQIDTNYFTYNELHKKHILNIDVSFRTNSSNIEDIPIETREKLLEAGVTIQKFIENASKEYNVKYLLIIEGQASRDNYSRNYELSYERALSLINFWLDKTRKRKLISFDPTQCEILISGSGQSGSLRVEPDNPNNKLNQRFLIHIIPKPGIIEDNT